MMMTSRGLRIVTTLFATLMVALAPGCASFEQGYKDSVEKKASPEYGWGHEIYEMPLGIAGIPFFIVLTPFIAAIPKDPHGMGYLAGDTWGSVRILLDPTTNYGG